MTTHHDLELPWRSATLGAQWLLGHLRTDGSLAGGDDLRAYYKTPAAFLAHGDTREAHRVFDYIESKLLLPNGDLDGSGVPWYSIYRTYPHSWICTAAVMGGRFRLARRLAEFIATWHNPASGGFYAGETRDLEEIMTTSMAGIASLAAGNTALAIAAGAWLENLYNAQHTTIASGLYTCWHNGLIRDYDEAAAPSYKIDPAKPRQYYFQYGISAALLTSLAGATGDQRWLDLASKFLRASAFAGPDRYQTPQAGKIGWGAAWTYRMTHNPEDLELVATVAASLKALQNDDGSWLVTGVYGGATAPADSATIDITSEFVALQSFMAQVPRV